MICKEHLAPHWAYEIGSTGHRCDMICAISDIDRPSLSMIEHEKSPPRGKSQPHEVADSY